MYNRGHMYYGFSLQHQKKERQLNDMDTNLPYIESQNLRLTSYQVLFRNFVTSIEAPTNILLYIRDLPQRSCNGEVQWGLPTLSNPFA